MDTQQRQFQVFCTATLADASERGPIRLVKSLPNLPSLIAACAAEFSLTGALFLKGGACCCHRPSRPLSDQPHTSRLPAKQLTPAASTHRTDIGQSVLTPASFHASIDSPNFFLVQSSKAADGGGDAADSSRVPESISAEVSIVPSINVLLQGGDYSFGTARE
jgi:hypothetical protein